MGIVSRLAILVTLTCLSGAAEAATYLIFVPSPIVVGGVSQEVYGVQTFEAHDGLSGPALADASLLELGRLLPDGLKGLEVSVAGTQAVVNHRGGDASAETMDLTLGAVFHTLRLSGINEVRFGDALLRPDSFSRGAMLPILPFFAALPPVRISHGYVVVGKELLAPKEFYKRISTGDRSIRDAVVRAMRDGSANVKLAILGRLSAVPLRDSNAVLLPALQDPDLRVRLTVLRALEGRRHPKIIRTLEEYIDGEPAPEAKTIAAKILVAAGKKDYQKYLLLEKLSDRDPNVVMQAASDLIAAGDAKLAPALAKLTSHPNPQVRLKGVEALSTFKQFAVMEQLLSNPELSMDVAQPLARSLTDEGSGRQQAVGVVFLLQRGRYDEALHAARVAGAKRVVGTTQALAGALKRSEADVRAAAARALGAMKDAQGLEPLAAAITSSPDPDEKRMYAEQAISIISVQPLNQVITISEKSPDKVIRELAVKSLAAFTRDRVNPRVLGILRRHAGGTEQTIVRAAVYALARIKNNPEELDNLLKLQAHQDPKVREQIAFALATGQHPEAENVLMKYLDDGDNLVKLQAVKSVQTRGMTKAMIKLKWLLEYRQTAIRREVVRAVISMVDPTDPKMFDVYQNRLYADRDAEIQLMLVNSLGNYPENPLQASVIGFAVTLQSAKVKLRALEVLSGSTDENAVEQAIRGLFDRDKTVKLATLDCLEKIAKNATQSAIKALREFLKQESDPELIKRAEEVMEKV
jgi:HEAT repeat protein